MVSICWFRNLHCTNLGVSIMWFINSTNKEFVYILLCKKKFKPKMRLKSRKGIIINYVTFCQVLTCYELRTSPLIPIFIKLDTIIAPETQWTCNPNYCTSFVAMKLFIALMSSNAFISLLLTYIVIYMRPSSSSLYILQHIASLL